MKKLFSRRKKPATIGRISHLHDSNEDILRIIKLYNQGTIKTINEDDPVKYPWLLKYRASNLYVFITAALSIVSSLYMNCAISTMTPYVIENQIRSDQQDSAFKDDVVDYVSSCFYFAGLLGGSLLFGWLGCQVRQRKLLLNIGSMCLLTASGAFVLSTQYWMLFPAKFLQGISNACTWIMSSAITADAWPLSKWGCMLGFLGGLFPLGATIGINGVGALSNHVSYFVSFYTALGLCGTAWMVQLFVIERSTIPEIWLVSKSDMPDEPAMKDKEPKQRETLDVMEGGSWSKSSSLSTINLRDQPIIFEKEKETETKPKDSIHDSILFRILTTIAILSLLYQLVVIATILETLKYTLLEKLELQMNIKNPMYQDIIVSTFLFPFSISAFISGWFCDMFGSKMVGLTSVIISIPTLIWIGVPNQNIQSVVAALAMSGTMIGGMSISTFVSTIKAIQKVQLEDQHDLTKQQQQALQREQSTLVFAFICTLFEIGFFASYFVAKLNDVIGFLWLCFLLAMMLATCIPLMAYFLKNKIKNTSSTSHKSIVNNSRPKSFAESCGSDDESTLGSVSSHESKAVIVVP